jgi:hypothetical protein
MGGYLQHWQYEAFKALWPDRTIEDALIAFPLNPDASIDSTGRLSSFDIRTCCSSRQRRNHSRQETHPTLENIGPFSRLAECPYLTGAARSN